MKTANDKKMNKTQDGVRKSKKGIASIFNINLATSIKAKIQKVVIFAVAVSMVVLGAVTCFLNYYSTVSSLEQSMSEMAVIAADRVEWQITAYKNIIQELGRTARLANDNYTVAQKQEIIDEKVKAYDCIRGKLIGTDGIALVDGTDYSDREYFQKSLKGETYMSSPLISKTDGSISLIISAPVWEGGVPDTKVVGVVFLSLNPDFLNDIVKSIHVSDNSGAYIINNTGTTVAHTTDGMMEAQNNTIANAKTDSSLQVIADLEEKMLAGQSGFGRYTYKGTSKFMSYAPIGNTDGWSIGLNAPVSDFLGDTILGIIITIILAIVFIAVAALYALKIGTSIGTPISKCAERLSRIVDGDLNSPVPEVKSNDEVGILSRSTKEITDGLNLIIGDIGYLLEQMAGGDFTVVSKASEKYVGDYSSILISVKGIKEQLGSMLASIQESAGQVSLGSSQMADSAQALAEGATDQAGAVEELTATIESVTEIARSSAETAEATLAAVEDAVIQAKSGGKAMEDLAGAMENITSTSQEIRNIITTIEDIASQTNLLSLNASIEAARAGEAGRGFAVVAEQIGKLASDSAKSAMDTRELIAKVLDEIEKGNQMTGKTSSIFDHVTNDMQNVSGKARESSQASDQQAQLLEQVEKGVEQISIVVQSNSASAQETSATSEELSAQAETMNQIVTQLRF